MEYKNGNYVVRIERDGTKTRLSTNPIPVFPESIDVKVTNSCNANCPYCHESSTRLGDSFDPVRAVKLFKELPSGVELAIGGGNPLEVVQDLRYVNQRINPIMNMTVNARHLENIDSRLPNLGALGISYDPGYQTNISKYILANGSSSPQIVIHLIAGVHTLGDFEWCLKNNRRVLVLGYKEFGRGAKYFSSEIANNLRLWKDKWYSISWNVKSDSIIAFDNLAVSQLSVSRYCSADKWSKEYMGSDGEFTMYLDLVKETYAVSSTSKRYPIGDKDIRQMFAHVRSLAGF